MERLTERINGKLTLKKQFSTIQDTLDIITSRLELYEDLEEQGMLLKLNAPIDIIIRCAMCTNIMRSDRGCDGGCQVDETLFNKIMDEILKNELK